MLARLMHAGLVRVDTVTQDGAPVRASASARSFGQRETLARRLADAADHVRAMGRLADESPTTAAGRQREWQTRAAARRPARASTTDPDARVERMPDNGYRPAHRVQLAQDPTSRAIVGVAVGADDKAEGPWMRAQVNRRAAAAAIAAVPMTMTTTTTIAPASPVAAAAAVRTHSYDGNYVKLAELDAAAAAGVTVLAPVAKPRKAGQDRYAPRASDSPAVAAWRRRMTAPAARAAYRARASTCETVNPDLTAHRGLGRLLVRGAGKVLCVALWSALAYNVMHFGAVLARGG